MIMQLSNLCTCSSVDRAVIEASYDEKEEAVTVSIYGTQTDNNTVEITTEHSDPNTCKTYRSVYDENGTLLRTDEVGYSKYKQ